MLSAKEYNRLITIVEGLARSGGKNTLIDSTGIHSRNTISTPIIHKAYAKNDAAALERIDCYLDTDATGEEITVYCEIAGGTELHTAIPRLEDGDMITVWNDNGTWRSIMIFQHARDC